MREGLIYLFIYFLEGLNISYKQSLTSANPGHIGPCRNLDIKQIYLFIFGGEGLKYFVQTVPYSYFAKPGHVGHWRNLDVKQFIIPHICYTI